ncbi:MAG: hypothetical protein ACI8YQ_004398, partial [Polaribacter sp.]
LANHLQVGGRFNDPSFTKANNLSESEYKRLCGMVGLILEYYLKLTTRPNRNFIKNLLKLPYRHLRKCVK